MEKINGLKAKLETFWRVEKLGVDLHSKRSKAPHMKAWKLALPHFQDTIFFTKRLET